MWGPASSGKEGLKRGSCPISPFSTLFPGQVLLSLLSPRQSRLRSEVEEALNTDLLKREAEHGALNVPHLSKYVLNTMALLCAPVRDEAVQKLDNITDSALLLRCEA